MRNKRLSNKMLTKSLLILFGATTLQAQAAPPYTDCASMQVDYPGITTITTGPAGATLANGECANGTGLGSVNGTSGTKTASPGTFYAIAAPYKYGVITANGGILNLDNIVIYSSVGSNTYGLQSRVSANSVINVSGTAYINTTESIDHGDGIWNNNGGKTTIKGFTTIRTGGPVSYGLGGIGANTTVTINNAVDIDTTDGGLGDGSFGAYALNNAVVTIDGSNAAANKIVTADNSSFGLYAEGGGTVNIATPSAGYPTSIDSSAGIGNSYIIGAAAVGSGATNSAINFTNVGPVSIKTAGDNSYGLLASAGGSINLASDTTIDTTTSGDNTYGVYATSNKLLVQVTGSTPYITTVSMPINYNALSAITFSNSASTLNVSTAGISSYGLFAETGSSIVNAGSTVIKSIGTAINKKGVYASDIGGNASLTPSSITLKSADVTTFGVGSSALRADAGAQISIDGVTSLNTAGSANGNNSYGAHADGVGNGNSSTINITGDATIATSIMTDGNYSYGLYANAGGLIKVVSAAGMTIDSTTSGDNTTGVYATNQIDFTDTTGKGAGTTAKSTITLSGGPVTVKTAGKDSYGMFAEGGSTITNDSATVINSNTVAALAGKKGVYASGDDGTTSSSITLQATDVTTSGANSSALRVDTGAKISITGVTSLNTAGAANGNNTYGAHADGIGNGNPSTINITGGAVATSIMTDGNYSYGLYANAGGLINIISVAGMTIDSTTSGDNTTGVYATNKVDATDDTGKASGTTAKSSITLSGGPVTIKTAGTASYGMFAEGGSAITNDSATTINSNTAAALADKIGVYASGDDGISPSSITLQNVDVATSGDGSSALRAELGAIISITGNTSLSTLGTGTHAYGAHADGFGNVGISTINITGGAATTSVITNGDYSYGLYADAGGAINIASPAGMIIDSSSSGNNTTGIYATNLNDSATSTAKSTITLTGGDVTVKTAGTDSYGMYSEGGSTISNDSATTIVSNLGTLTGKIGVYANGDDGAATPSLSTITLTNDLTITSGGDGSSGIRAEAGGQVTITGNVSIDSTASGNNTLGMHAFGLASNNTPSTITVGSTTAIDTAGTGSHGIAVDNGGKIVINGPATVKTSGANSAGVLVDDTKTDSTISLSPTNNYSITTTGATSHGLAIIKNTNPASGLIKTTILVSGTGSDAINITGDQVDVTMSIINSNLTSLLHNGITVDSGAGHTRDITVDPSTITACNGYALYASNNSNVKFNLTASSTLNGAVATDAANSLIDMTIDNTSVWNAASTTATAGCTTASTKSSSVHSLTNNGTTSLAGLGAGKSLTIAGNYTATAATLVVDAALAGDNSPITKLVVNGVATGDTTITVNNLGGVGAPTNVGIPVVMVTDPASTGTFSLAAPITVGTYTYTLKQGGYGGNANSWYLVNGVPPAPTISPIPALSNLMLLVIALSLGFVSLLKLNVLNFRKN